LAAEHKVSHLIQKLEMVTAKNASLQKHIKAQSAIVVNHNENAQILERQINETEQ